MAEIIGFATRVSLGHTLETEHCVFCDEDTQIPRTLEVSDSRRYQNGHFYSLRNGGQVCSTCAKQHNLHPERKF